jgi:hypothetical protein
MLAVALGAVIRGSPIDHGGDKNYGGVGWSRKVYE